jgi:hypothetical protein
VDSVVDLLATAKAAGLSVHSEGEKLVMRGPRKAKDLALMLAARKTDVLNALASRQSSVVSSLAHHGGLDDNAPSFHMDFTERNEFYWQNISDEDRAHLLGPRNWPKPCAWCGGRVAHSPACKELRKGWELKMPFGKHKGVALSDVPSHYLQRLVWFNVKMSNELREAVKRTLQEKLR